MNAPKKKFRTSLVSVRYIPRSVGIPTAAIWKRMDLLVSFLIMLVVIAFLGLGLGWLTKLLLESDGRRRP